MQWHKITYEQRALVFGAVGALTILVGVGLLGYIFRAELFGFFAKEYTQSMQVKMQAMATSSVAQQHENQKVVRSVLTQEAQVIDAVASAVPAVVSIVATKDVPVMERYYRDFDPFGDGFGFRIPDYRQKGVEEQRVGSGSGFIVSESGLVVTNKHVVADPDAAYTVFTNDGAKHPAEVIARDPFVDLAVLQIADKSGPFPSLAFGNSDRLKLGQTVIAIGNALGEFQNSVSTGVISGLSRSVVAQGGGRTEQLDQVIQTDAAINPGNSGGPLLDTNGNVVGVNVAVARGSENIGFALPGNLAARAVASIKAHGEIVRPYIGVRYVMITQALIKENNLPVDHGALIRRGAQNQLAVLPGSPADKAGLVENDIIIEVEGKAVTEDNPLGVLIRKYNVGDTITLTVYHRGEEKTVSVTLEKAPTTL